MHPTARIILPLSLLLLPSFALANELADQINAQITMVADYSKQIADLDKTVGQPLVAEKTRLSASGDTLKNSERSMKNKYDDWSRRVTGPGGYSSQMNAHEAKIAPFNARTSDYNRRCRGTFSDINHVNACNREKARFDAEADDFQREYVQLKNLQSRLRAEKTTLDTQEKELRDRRRDLNRATLEWAEKVKRYNARRGDLVAARGRALAQLRQLGSQYGSCVDRLPKDATDESIKLRCGNARFDNVRRNLQELREIKAPFTAAPNR